MLGHYIHALQGAAAMTNCDNEKGEPGLTFFMWDA
jgi:hypothetical protein